MAKLLHVGKKIINLDSVDYIDLGEEDHSTVTVHFGSQMSLQFTGSDATRLWELLKEENFFFGSSNPTD